MTEETEHCASQHARSRNIQFISDAVAGQLLQALARAKEELAVGLLMSLSLIVALDRVVHTILDVH
jgi:hypothetical protein